MRRLILAALALVLAACGQQAAIAELSHCERELGAADTQLAAAQAAQAAAERKAQALEDEVRAAREELAATRGAAQAQAQSQAVPQASPAADAEAAAPAAPAQPADRSGKRLRVGLSLPQREERWVKDKLTMLAEAKRRGIDLLVQTSDEAQRQIAQCDDLISQGIKVLILAPNDAAAAAAIVDRATRAGVQVISYDRLVLDSPHDYYYLSFDNVKVGELQGEWLARKVPKGKVIVLAGAPTDNNAKLVKQGGMKFLQPLIDRGDLKVVLDQAVRDWAPAEAQKLCEQALARSDDLQGVLAPNDGTAGGCVQALAARGLAGKVPITGQDGDLAAAIRILRGEQGMTVFKDTRNLGKTALEMAEVIGRGKRYDTGGRTVSNNKRQVRAVLLSPTLVTRENLDDKLVRSGYLSSAAVYRK